MKTSLYAIQDAFRRVLILQLMAVLSCIQKERARPCSTDANPNLPNDFGKS